MPNLKSLNVVYLLMVFFFSDPVFSQSTFSDNSRAAPLTNNFGGSPDAMASGFLNFTSNFLENGITQTNNDPAVQASLWLHIGPSLNFGVWGSNVNFNYAASEHLVLRPYMEIKLLITPLINTFIKYSVKKYYHTTTRDGSVFEVYVEGYGFRGGFASEPNWNGTNEPLFGYCFSYAYKFLNRFNWFNELRYNKVSPAGYSSYMNLLSILEYKVGPVTFQLSESFLSPKNQVFSQPNSISMLGLLASF